MLKKVLEQDEPARRPMVLCIASVLQHAPGAGPPAVPKMALRAHVYLDFSHYLHKKISGSQDYIPGLISSD